MIRKGLTLAFAWFSLTSAARAETITWSEAVQLTVKNNSKLKASEAALRSSGFSEDGSYAKFLPQVSGSLSWGRSGSEPAGTSDGGTSYSADLEGKQNLFAGLADWSTVKEAKAQRKIKEQELRQTKAQVSYDLKTAYEGAFYAQELAKLAQNIIKRRQENLKLVDLRFQNGRENKGSLALSQANLSQARYDELQALNAARTAQAQLARALGLDDFATHQAADQVPITPPPPSPPDLKDLALTTPDYQKALASLESAEAKFGQARAGFLPSLDLTGTVGRRDDEYFPEANKTWSVGLKLSLPLFNGGRDYFGTRAAAENRSSADQERYDVSRDLLRKLQAAFSAFTESAMKLEVDDSFRKAATLRAEIARSKYNNGLLTFEDWDQIESDLIVRQKAYLQSRLNRVTNEAAWEQSQGKGVIP